MDTRFKDADHMQILPNITIALIGNGGTGSWAGLAIARMGLTELFNYEMDVVDYTNLGGQHYDKSCIGQRKDEMFLRMLQEFSDFENVSNLGQFNKGSDVTPITMCCVDDNGVRRDIFDQWYKLGVEMNWKWTITNSKGKTVTMPFLLLDSRMSFWKYDIYCVTQADALLHREHFIPRDKDVAEDTCAMKANTVVGMIAGGMQVQRLTNAITNAVEHNEMGDWTLDVTSAPWRTRHDLQFNQNTTDPRCYNPTK